MIFFGLLSVKCVFNEKQKYDSAALQLVVSRAADDMAV